MSCHRLRFEVKDEFNIMLYVDLQMHCCNRRISEEKQIHRL